MKKIIIMALLGTVLSSAAQAQSFYRFKTKTIKSQPYVYYAPRGNEKEMKGKKFQFKKHKLRRKVRVQRANYNRKRKAIRKQMKGLQ